MSPRILGLDPGSRHTGYGCIDSEGSRAALVAQGRISSPARVPLADKLARISTELGTLVDRLQPAVTVLEKPFSGVNSRSLIVLAQARGALLATLALRGLAVEELTPAEVKNAVTGNGRAPKAQVARMVRMLLGLGDLRLSQDASDALAVALCWAARQPMRAALARGEGRSSKRK